MQRIVLRFLVMCVACGCLHAAAVAAEHDGDVNMDGTLNLIDLLWGTQAVVDLRSLSPGAEAQGDVAPLVSGIPQPDGSFNLADVLLIQRMILTGLDFSLPGNQSTLGDSIGEAEAADGTIGEPHHETVWSTGYAVDAVNSFNERYEALDAAAYYENTAARDPTFNHAVSGAVMADFAGQAQNAITAAAATPSGRVQSLTVLLGNNDVCATSLAAMTDPALFETQFRAGLDILAASDTTRLAQLQVSGLPAIYWLWDAKRTDFWCRVFVWPFVPCENLLDSPADDCASSASREDPDVIYPGDGENCQRRKTLHALIRDSYNPILSNVIDEYRASGQLPNARYSDIFDVRFSSTHVNDGDCFHPSTTGHALLADSAWCRTHWGHNDPACAP